MDEMTDEQKAIIKDFDEWSGGFHPSEITVEEIETYIELTYQTQWSEENKKWLRKQGGM